MMPQGDCLTHELKRPLDFIRLKNERREKKFSFPSWHDLRLNGFIKYALRDLLWLRRCCKGTNEIMKAGILPRRLFRI